MQIVIDIPEYVYEAVKEVQKMCAEQSSGKTLLQILVNSVQNGIPLPKGHGDLIDRHIVLNEIYKYMYDRNYAVGHLYDVISEKTAVIEREE